MNKNKRIAGIPKNMVDYGINDAKVIGFVTTDGEIIDKKQVLELKVDAETKKQLTAKQESRLYFKVFIDALGSIYQLSNNEKNVLFYINSYIVYTRKQPNKRKLFFSVNQAFYEDCEEETGVPIQSIKNCLSTLKEKGFISNYKSAKEDRFIKGAYVANPKFVYSGTPEDYVNDYFELQLKGIFISFD